MPSNTIEEARLQTRIVSDVASCYWVTWRCTSCAATAVPRLRKVEVPIVNRDRCDGQRRPWEDSIGEGNICTLLAEPEVGILNPGDPLYCNNQLTAIHAYNVQFTVTPNVLQYSVGTQIRFVHNWIHQQLVRTQPMPAGWNPQEY